MPNKPLKPCCFPRCFELTPHRYCEYHRKKRQHDYDQRRGSASSRGYDARWRRARSSFLKRNPVCVRCEQEGKVVAAIVVDHIKPHKGDRELFWDYSNWQALCTSCHSRKTVLEDRLI